jgi:hypothetical protein
MLGKSRVVNEEDMRLLSFYEGWDKVGGFERMK